MTCRSELNEWINSNLVGLCEKWSHACEEQNQSRLQKILQFRGSKEVCDQDTIRALENEMMSGLPTNSAGPRRELLAADPSAAAARLSHQAANQSALQWKSDAQVPPLPNLANQDNAVLPIPSAAPHQFHPGVVPPTQFPVLSSVLQGNLQAAAHPMPASTANAGGKLSPEITEVKPSEGPVKPSDSANNYDVYESEPPVSRGGACIPPPPNLQVDPETGSYPDGSVEQKPGLNNSGRLGLGATANPDKSSQYDDVDTSYRKERSTNYHSSLSARATRIIVSSIAEARDVDLLSYM
ncbi:hypothetical protein HAX54_040801 [Datura stramonium]|uniref:SUPPRESSOR-OF-WHITE-APRICOT-like C-terminal domain-containing protein n=1 Tax=Datura stramonium TaxID=4076 RepID=A0ABS8VRE6_DATST|nr:hypothetical protein [Datura stramonium]